MKPKYILSTYDKLLQDIINSKLVERNKIIPAIQKIAAESFLCYTVKFNKNKSYSIATAVHNLHPSAPNLNNFKQDIHPELQKVIPAILNELKVTDKNALYYWNIKLESNSLLITVNVNLQDLPIESISFIYLYQKLTAENSKIQRQIKGNIFQLTNSDSIKQYIYKQQLSIRNLINTTIKEIGANSFSELYQFSNQLDKNDHLKVIYVCLEKLLQFIEKEYWEYLDSDAIVSYQTLMQEHQKLKGKLNFVKAQLLATNSNEVLLNIAFEPFEKMTLTTTNQKLTYNEFCYASQYIIETEHYFKTKSEIFESDLSGLLFNLNLNSLQLFEYHIDEIILEMNQCESDSDKINILYHKLKTINQKRLKIKTVFNAAYPSIKVQIKSWIEEEIEYLNWKLKAKSFSHGIAIVEKDKPKMQTDLSVAQLSYLFNLLNQSGVIKHNNQREIFRFISDNFQTKTTSEISVASIKNRYYDAESSTQSAVRDKILQLLNLTKS